MIRALLFDFDGTLAETEETHRQAFNAAFAEAQLPIRWSEDEYETLLRVAGGKERLAHHFAQLDVPLDERRRLQALVPELHARKTLHFAALLRGASPLLRPGVARLLAEAEAAGTRVGIASTTTFANVKAVLDAELGLGWEARFAVIACGDAVEAKKPAPDVYQYALAQLGLTGADVVAFEDSENGVAAAKAAGIFTVATPSRYSSRDDLSAADITLPHLGDPSYPLIGEQSARAGGPFLTLDQLDRLWVSRALEASLGPARLTQAKTWAEFLVGVQGRSSGVTGMLPSVLDGIRLACQRIQGILGAHTTMSHHDARRAATEIFLATLEPLGSVAGLAIDDHEEPRSRSAPFPNARYLVAVDPIDCARNVEANLPVGTVFSVLRAPDGLPAPTKEDFLRAGTLQVAAGYALYGPATVLVLTVGEGSFGFTLDRARGEFVLTHDRLSTPASALELAVDTALAASWEPPLKRYVAECLQGTAGSRGRPFALRWVGSVVADVHRILVHGGVYVCPVAGDRANGGGLRLIYKANPMAMLIEQAGGSASTGSERILDIAPQEYGRRVPAIFGARDEVERLARYEREHRAGLDPEFRSPLFNERSLFPPR